jgi:L-aminopeptidase/D-esterase-like protein
MDIRTTHVPGFKIGTAEDREGLTGVTVFLAPEDGAAAGLDVRGCAPGTRETDLLSPEKNRAENSCCRIIRRISLRP